jgi:hypothetical protein
VELVVRAKLMGVGIRWRKHQKVLRTVEVHRPFCGHPHWFSEAVGQIEFGGERFFSVLESHAPRLTTDLARVPPYAGTVGQTTRKIRSTS